MQAVPGANNKNTRCVWLLMGALAVADAAGLEIQAMSLAPKVFLFSGLIIGGLLLLSFFYTRFRREERIAALAHMGAVILAFTAVAAIASYLVAAWDRPLIDPCLVAADRALGLDWPSAYRWVVSHRLIRIALIITYQSLIPQMIFLLVLLNFFGWSARGWEMLWLFMAACIGCLFFSAVWPAAGAFSYFHVETNTPYIRAFTTLRDGTLRVIGREPVEGIITFPSLHAALAIIYAYCARGIRYLFPFFIALNAMVFAATPIVGGHHFADLWGGVALTLVTILTVRRVSAMNSVAAPSG